MRHHNAVGLDQIGPTRRAINYQPNVPIEVAARNERARHRGEWSIAGRSKNSTKNRKVKITLPSLRGGP